MAFDQIRFKKMGEKQFLVSVPKSLTAKTGEIVTVEKRDGSSSKVTLGTMVETNKYGDQLFEYSQIKE